MGGLDCGQGDASRDEYFFIGCCFDVECKVNHSAPIHHPEGSEDDRRDLRRMHEELVQQTRLASWGPYAFAPPLLWMTDGYKLNFLPKLLRYLLQLSSHHRIALKYCLGRIIHYQYLHSQHS